VLNKVDRVDEPLHLQSLVSGRREESVRVSARTGDGLDELEALLRVRIDARSPVVEVRISAADGKGIAALKSAGKVLEQRVDAEDELVLRLRLLDGALGGLQSMLGRRARFDVLEPAVEPFFRGG